MGDDNRRSELKLLLTQIVGAAKYEGYALAYNGATSDPIWAIRRIVYEAGTFSYAWALLGKAACVWDQKSTYFPTAPPGGFPEDQTSILDSGGNPFSAGNPLPVDVVTGTIAISDLMTNNVISGSQAALAYLASADLFNFTAGAPIRIPEIFGGGDSYGAFELFVRGASWGVRRNSWSERQVRFNVGVISLDVGENIRMVATNTSVSGNAADYEGYAYYGS